MLAQLASLGWYMRDEYPRQHLHFWYGAPRVIYWTGPFAMPIFLEMPERPRWPRVPR